LSRIALIFIARKGVKIGLTALRASESMNQTEQPNSNAHSGREQQGFCSASIANGGNGRSRFQ